MPALSPDTPSGQPAAASSNDEIVITGLSGRLPESNSIEEFKDQLFAGVDLVTADDRRWPTGQSKITLDVSLSLNLVLRHCFRTLFKKMINYLK